jgi:aromatic ring-opening dioxygenase LigB subunit
VPLVFAAIAPHADLAIEEAVPAEHAHEGRDTRAAMAEAARRFEAAAPDATIVVTPHNVHVEGHFAVAVAAELRGGLGAFLPRSHDIVPLELSCPADTELAVGALTALDEAGIPALAASFGGNNPPEAVMPMDWGTLVPLWHFGGRSDPPVPAVVVSPARDRSLEEHVRAGEALAEAARRSRKRVALVASADHGHAHDPVGPYGFDVAAAEYDGRVVDAVREGRLEVLLELEELAGRAKADSLWQMVVLHGALGSDFRGELLAYEAPRYYGMVVAAYEPV